jgi:hypothetical protein
MALRLCTDKLFIISMKQIRLLSSQKQFRSFSSVKSNDQFKVCNQCIAPFECLYHKRCKYPDDGYFIDDIALYTTLDYSPSTASKCGTDSNFCETDYDFGVNE